jgi:hypothetical protein
MRSSVLVRLDVGVVEVVVEVVVHVVVLLLVAVLVDVRVVVDVDVEAVSSRPYASYSAPS